MKKKMILVVIGILLVGFLSPVLSNAEGKGFFLGMNFGGIPIAGMYNGYSVGGEIGYQFSERVAFIADVAYGNQSFSDEYQGSNYSYSDEISFSTLPVSGSFIFITPVGKEFSSQIGLGLGYYSIKIQEDSRSNSTYNGPESEEETFNMNGIAPHVSFGIEAAVSKYASIYGEVKYSIGKVVLEDENSYGSSSYDMQFGGPQVKIGFRIYFK